jgi:hypothetical protein
VFLERDEVAAFERGQALVNQRLRPCHVVLLAVLVVRDFGNAVVDRWRAASSTEAKSPVATCALIHVSLEEAVLRRFDVSSDRRLFNIVES